MVPSPPTTYLAAPRAACSQAPTKQTCWPVKPARMKCAALVVQVTSTEEMATTLYTAGRVTTTISTEELATTSSTLGRVTTAWRRPRLAMVAMMSTTGAPAMTGYSTE